MVLSSLVRRQTRVNDNADNRCQRLKIDAEGAVDDDRLRACCNESADAFNWLAKNGAKFADPPTGKPAYLHKQNASLICTNVDFTSECLVNIRYVL